MGSDEDTIVALATAPGRGAVAIVRISGAGALSVGDLFGFTLPTPRLASVRNLKHGSVTLDQALVLLFVGPGSYTGEDLVELQIHGGRAVYDSVVTVLLNAPGFRYAEPGEFSRRAVLNGRLDLTEAEAVNDLVNAETEAQRDLAVMQLGGSLRGIFDGWAAELTGIRAHLEAYIDFPDEDIPEAVLTELVSDSTKMVTEMRELLDDERRGERLREGMRIAVVGPPNAGKSSFVNWLAERDVAIVSSMAGTTRDVIEVHLNLGGYPVTVADTAGVRDGGDVVEIEGMRRARAWAADADLRVLVVEAAGVGNMRVSDHGVEAGDLVLINKSDLLGEGLVELPNVGVEEGRSLLVSVKTGVGLSGALGILTDIARERMDVSNRPAISRSRHRAALLDSVKSIRAGLEGLGQGIEPEIVAEEFRQAANTLGRITGRVDVEDLLDVVFRDFCIGK